MALIIGAMKFRILPVLGLFIFLHGCIEKPSAINPVEFTGYISGYTYGVISKKDPLRIRLSQPVTAFEPGKELPAGLFDFSPPCKGVAYLVSPDLVEFRPANDWMPGRVVKATFRLGRVLDVPDRLEKFPFEFSIVNPSFSVYPGKSISRGEGRNKWKKIEGTLVSADAMEPAEAAKLLKAVSFGQELDIQWEPGASMNEFFFYIDSLPRGEEAYDVVIKWDGRPLGISVKGDFTHTIPSIHDFVFMGLHPGRDEEQYVDIVFSDPLDPVQDLDGLIYLKEGDPGRLVADGNVVRFYPRQRIQGERTLVVETGVRNDIRTGLKSRVEETVVFEELKPAVEFIGQGVIMPDPQGLSIPIRAVNLRAVDVMVYKLFENNIPYYLQENQLTNRWFYNFRQWGRPVYARTVMLDEDKSVNLGAWNSFALDLSALISEDPGAAYRLRLSFRKAYSLYPCAGQEMEDISKYVLDGSPAAAMLAAYDSPQIWYNEDDWPDDYDWSERDNPCHVSYYINNRFAERLVLSSNLGALAKSSDGLSYTVVVTDLLRAEPVPGATVGFFNFQNQPLGSATSGNDGMASIALAGRPYFLRVSKERQVTWLRIDDGSSLSLSNFDVGGAEVQRGLKGMIYGERGVWRPGDSLYLTFILDDRANPLPASHPVSLELINPRGQMAYSTVQAGGMNGFYPFRLATSPDAPTGNWQARVKVGGVIFEKTLKIETVKPNRLKISMNFNQDVLQSFSGQPEAGLEVKWLHGAVAKGIRASVNMSFRRAKTAFRGYEKFAFENPASQFWSEERNIFDKELDPQGKGRFSLSLPSGGTAPGLMEAVFLVRAFEKGGDFSTDLFTSRYSPYRRYVGLHVPDGGSYQDMLETDKAHRVEVALLDWKGSPVSGDGLEVKVYKVEWRWWWNAGEDNLAYYIQSQDARVIYQGKVDVRNGSGSFDLRVDYPEWGRYLILVRDPEGGHQAGLAVYFDWPGYVNRSGRANPAGATMLTLGADKDKYRTGERAVISFPAAPGSRALVTVETGSKVLSSQWKVCRNAEETFDIMLTPAMSPNVYVYLSLIQPYGQTRNDLPIRMYGVIPLLVEDPATVLQPVINMPGELRPDEPFTVKVSEKDGKPMTFTLAVVDDGLLDLTRFRTPDPHGIFYAREALGVKTWDMYDMVLGAYGGKLQKILAIGGDDEALMAKDRKASRFVPVVKYAGPYTLKKGEKKEINLVMPNYVGSVRTMVIAGKDGAYGHAEKTTPVRKPLMVLATLPRVLGPGEEVELPVSVFAMSDEISEAEVRIETEGISSLQENKRRVTFNGPGEQMAWFRLKAPEKAGLARVKVIASGGRESASHEIMIEVRNPNPFMSESMGYVAGPGETLSVPWQFFGLEGTNAGKITFSGLPDFDLQKHLGYLIQYPYGCLEQTVSAALPQLYLPALAELSAEQRQKADQHIRHAISRIAQMSLPDGSVTYWPGQTTPGSWVTSYAGHFMLLAESRGFLLPSGMKEKWTEYQYRTASNFQSNSPDHLPSATLNQAYRLYTLALAQKPNLGAMNRLRESGRLTASSVWVLASAYAHAGKPEVAEAMILGRQAGVTDAYPFAGETYGSGLRDMAFTLETLILLKKEQEAFPLMQQMASLLKGSWHSTQSAAFGLMAMALYAGDHAGKGVEAEYQFSGAGRQKVSTPRAVYQFDVKESQGMKGAMTVTNLKPDARLFVNLTLTGQPAGGMESAKSSHLKISVACKDEGGQLLDVASLRQGAEFTAEVTVEHPGLLTSYADLALNQVFPSGWEIINTRITDVAPGPTEDPYDYRDIRDDRVTTFFNLSQGGKKTFRVRLNAAYAGRYYLPAAICGAMYEESIYAHTQGRWVEVVR